MIKITANSVMVCSILLCSSTIAMAGSPYNLTLPPPGARGMPHVANPSLRQRPVISRSMGHAQQTAASIQLYTAITKSRARRQGIVSAGRVRWNCRSNHCTAKAAWARPTVQVCKSLAHSVGAIKSFGKRRAGLNTGELRSCNAGIAVAKINKRTQTLSNRGVVTNALLLTPHLPVRGVPISRSGGVHLSSPQTPGHGGFTPKPRASPATGNLGKAGGSQFNNRVGGGFAPKQLLNGRATANASSSTRPHRGGFAPARPSTTRGTTSGGSSPAPSRSRGGFAPSGLAGQVHVRNVLSPQQIARISGVQEAWNRYQRAVEEQRRRDEAAVQERIRRLSAEAYHSGADCDDSDPEIHPGLLEICDHKDNNCDGRIDEGATILAFPDVDGDGHGDQNSEGVAVCQSDFTAAQRRREWLSDKNNDCNDADPDHWHDCPAP